jgi:hypothetical protein
MSPPGLRFGTIRHVATRGEFENLNTVGDELGFRERINLLLQPSPRLVAAQQAACKNLLENYVGGHMISPIFNRQPSSVLCEAFDCQISGATGAARNFAVSLFLSFATKSIN